MVLCLYVTVNSIDIRKWKACLFSGYDRRVSVVAYIQTVQDIAFLPGIGGWNNGLSTVVKVALPIHFE
jgi:hypothetical protein